MMLAYIEQQPLYNTANFMLNPNSSFVPGGPMNSTAVNTRINVFECPSDGTLISGGTARLMNYHGSIGTTTDPWNTNSTGPFAHGVAYGISSVIDGTSNTILFSEALRGKNNPRSTHRTSVANTGMTGGRALHPVVLSGNTTTLSAGVQAALQQCNQLWTNAATSTANTGSNRGQFWAIGSPGYCFFNTVIPPNSTQYAWSSCRTDNANGGSDYADYIKASSAHSGGVNAALCDGSVRFIKDSIAPQTWWAIGTKDGGEAISADSF